jgi:hypothetical protein
VQICRKTMHVVAQINRLFSRESLEFRPGLGSGSIGAAGARVGHENGKTAADFTDFTKVGRFLSMKSVRLSACLRIHACGVN